MKIPKFHIGFGFRSLGFGAWGLRFRVVPESSVSGGWTIEGLAFS